MKKQLLAFHGEEGDRLFVYTYYYQTERGKGIQEGEGDGRIISPERKASSTLRESEHFGEKRRVQGRDEGATTLTRRGEKGPTL